MWDLIVSVPDHCLSFYFGIYNTRIYLNRVIPIYYIPIKLSRLVCTVRNVQ